MIRERTIHFAPGQEDTTRSVLVGRASNKEGGSRFEQEDNLLVLDGTVSKRHAIVDIAATRGQVLVSITDLGSQHGTVWKDKLLPSGASVSLSDGDCIGLVCSKKYQSPGSEVESIAHWTYAPLDCCKFLFQVGILSNSIVFKLVDSKEFSQEAESIADSDSVEFEDHTSVEEPQYVPENVPGVGEVPEELHEDSDHFHHGSSYSEGIYDDLEVEELPSSEAADYLEEVYDEEAGEQDHQEELDQLSSDHMETVVFSDDEVTEVSFVPQTITLEAVYSEEEEFDSEEQTGAERPEDCKEEEEELDSGLGENHQESDSESTFSSKKRSFDEVENSEEDKVSASSLGSVPNVDIPSAKKLRFVLVPEDDVKNTIKSKLYAGVIGAVIGSAFTFGTLASIGRSLNESL